jgi:hypothetical protein
MRGILLVLALSAAAADTVPASLESQRRAQAVVEAALKAHGGDRTNGKLHVRYRAETVTEGQSQAALAPFEAYPFEVEIALDPTAGLVFARTDGWISGDFHFPYRTVLRQGKGFSYDPVVNTHDEATGDPWVLDRYLAHRPLQQALRNAASLRHLGSDGKQERVSYATSNGQLATLTIDAGTRLLLGVEQVASFGIFGDGVRELAFEAYRNEAGLALPGTIVARNHSAVHGPVENRFRLERASAEPALAPADLELPAGAVKGDYSWRAAQRVDTLAPGVFLLHNLTSTKDQWSYNVLAVEFADHLLVAEAPLNGGITDNVLARLREVAPGKPVRYLVQSHHHSDHLGGIRGYIAEGTTLVLSPSCAALVERIAAAHPTISPDRLARSPRPPVIERVPARGSRTFKDARQEAVVFDVGPNPHSPEMLVVWLPAHGILYQSDLVNDGEYPVNATTRSFVAWLRGKGLDVRTMASLHGRTLDAAGVKRALAEAK